MKLKESTSRNRERRRIKRITRRTEENTYIYIHIRKCLGIEEELRKKNAT